MTIPHNARSFKRPSVVFAALLILSVILNVIGIAPGPQAWAGTPNEMTTLVKGGVVINDEQAGDPAKQKGPATVSAKIIIPRPPDQVWPVVINPEDLMCEERKVKEIKTVARTGNTVDVEYTVMYNRLLPTFNYTLRLENKHPNLIRFHRLSGSFKDFEGSWRLTPLENGQKTLLTYTLSIDPGFFAPKFLVVQAIKSDLPNMMRNVKTAIDKKVAAKGIGSTRHPK